MAMGPALSAPFRRRCRESSPNLGAGTSSRLRSHGSMLASIFEIVKGDESLPSDRHQPHADGRCGHGIGTGVHQGAPTTREGGARKCGRSARHLGALAGLTEQRYHYAMGRHVQGAHRRKPSRWRWLIRLTRGIPAREAAWIRHSLLCASAILLLACPRNTACAADMDGCAGTSRLVPASTRQIGLAGSSANPLRVVSIAAFCMDDDEMSVGRYRKCVDHHICSAAPLAAIGSRSDYFAAISNLTQSDAEAACRFEGKRLPSQAEWVLAAKGESGWTMPHDTLYRSVTPLSHFQGQSGVAYGVDFQDVADHRLFRMGGNVSEWTSTLVLGVPVIQGGSYRFVSPNFETARLMSASAMSDDVGVRCASNNFTQANPGRPNG
jgi:hypothetical protein